MKWLKIMFQIIILYGFYRIGVLFQQAWNIPIPGSVIGMVLLFLLLMLGIVKVNTLKTGASTLLVYMPLLFIPATVGVMDYFSLFVGKGFLAILAVLISTLLVMLISGLLGQRAANYLEKKEEQNKSKKEETA